MLVVSQTGIQRVLGTRVGDDWPRWGLYQRGGWCGGCALSLSWTEGIFQLMVKSWMNQDRQWSGLWNRCSKVCLNLQLYRLQMVDHLVLYGLSGLLQRPLSCCPCSQKVWILEGWEGGQDGVKNKNQPKQEQKRWWLQYLHAAILFNCPFYFFLVTHICFCP